MGENGSPWELRIAISLFCQRMTSTDSISSMRISPNVGSSLSRIMYSFCIQVLSRRRGSMSFLYTSMKAAKVELTEPSASSLPASSHSSAASSVAKPRLVLWRLFPL